LVSLDEREAKMRGEVTRVKHLKGGAPWVVSNREEGQLFLDDMVGEVNGIGDSITKKLQHVGITTTTNLKNMTEEKVGRQQLQNLPGGCPYRC
jgi:predicted flap endonuclease-1-like 5' DNA nuclease